MPPTLLFNPSPDLTPRVIDLLLSPDESLRSVATAFNTTTDALSLWATSPDIRGRLAITENFTAQRARHAATSHLHTVVAAIAAMLNGYTHHERTAPHPQTPEELDQRERQRSNARRAAFLLHRVAHFYPAPPPAARPKVARLSEPCLHPQNSQVSDPTAPNPKTPNPETPNPGIAIPGLSDIPGFVHPAATAPVAQHGSHPRPTDTLAHSPPRPTPALDLETLAAMLEDLAIQAGLDPAELDVPCTTDGSPASAPHTAPAPLIRTEPRTAVSPQFDGPGSATHPAPAPSTPTTPTTQHTNQSTTQRPPHTPAPPTKSEIPDFKSSPDPSDTPSPAACSAPPAFRPSCPELIGAADSS